MFGNFTYNKRVAVILAICILIPSIIILFIFAKQNSDEIYDTIDSEVADIMDSVNNNAIEISNSMYQKIKFITYYSELNDILQAEEKTKINSSLLEKKREISNVMSALFSENNILEMSIYTTNRNAASLGVIKYIKNPAEFTFVDDDSMGTWRIEQIETERVLSVYKKYAILDDNYNVIKISIPFRNITSAFSGIKYENSYVSVDMKNADALTFSYNTGKYEECDIPRGDFYKIEAEIAPFNIKTNLFIDKSSVNASLMKGILIFILGFIVLILFVVGVSTIISNRLVKGIMDIVEGISTNNMDIIKNSAYRSRETDIIKEHLLELQVKLKEENNEKLNFESELLAERISPHFLYNNLSAIKSNCTNDKARRAIDGLVRYYRNVFQKGSRITTVSREIENGIEYLNLMRFSYDSDFDIEIDIEKECRERIILSNILQPVLENAFIHGINILTQKKGYIRIEAFLQGNDTLIRVTDNGGNFDLERFEQRMNDENKKHAIKMIIARMKLFYDDDKYTIRIFGDSEKTVVEYTFGENI